ncbi:hypothetical protein QAD02_008059 [Eretmocerus hayati]|uniref:Uncharacterized protein n=1 Tax=Eretmocerus hayati TaxID=131215 RepID=A0ACC2N5P3_9HYME|nr:hypothetical protein QAD02_008059 [Eretmocerus hayati]
MGDSLDCIIDPGESQTVTTVDYDMFCDYLRKAITVLQPEEEAQHNFNIALEDKTNQECVRRFISDPQIWALSLQRTSCKARMSLEPATRPVRYAAVRLSCCRHPTRDVEVFRSVMLKDYSQGDEPHLHPHVWVAPEPTLEKRETSSSAVGGLRLWLASASRTGTLG